MPSVPIADELPSRSSFHVASAFASRGAVGLFFLVAQLALPPATYAAASSAAPESKTSSVTSLAMTAADSPVTSVESGKVVTLTAKVTVDGKAVSPGQVNFCEVPAKSCTDIHLLATVQLSTKGTAAYNFRPGAGSHGYKAEFLGNLTTAGSSSGSSTLQVTGKAVQVASATAISESGEWGQYKLSAQVTEVGSTALPSGTVSFLDTSNKNAVLGRGSLGEATPGLTWLSSQTLGNSYSGLVAEGDFNGDGIPDIAVASGYSLTILLGKGDGTFTALAPSSVINFDPGAIAVGDFNNDGVLDLAVANSYANTVVILLGHGNGTFTAAASSPATGTDPVGLAVGDFNGDGIADLAVVNGNNSGNGTLTILLGKGNGTFTAAAAGPALGESAFAIVTGDFNRDGKTDLAVTNLYNDNLTILLGKGDGTFVAAASPAVTSYCSYIAAADFNGDGNPDLVVGCSNEGLVKLLLGNGNGTFNAAPAFPSGEIQPSALVVADFNEDGKPDIAILDSFGTSGVYVFEGNGDGTFEQSPIIPAAGYFQSLLVTGDFNGDGRPDLAVLSSSYTGSFVYLTEPTEAATATASISLGSAGQHLVDASYGGSEDYDSSVSGTIPLWGVPPATTIALSVTAGNAAVTSVTPGTMVTLKAKVLAAGLTLTAGQVNFCDAGAALCSDIHLLGTASITSNGTATFEFAPGPGSHSYKAELLEEGHGKASSSNVVSLEVGPAPAPKYTAATTIASSGFPGNYSLTATVEGVGGSAAPTGKVSFVDTSFSNKVLATAPLGATNAGIGWTIGPTSPLSNAPTSEVTGDFNGDGIPDLALLWISSYGNPYSITIFFGKGNGTFTEGPTTQLTSAQYPPQMITGDFNGDGKTDLVIVSIGDYDGKGYVTCLLGKGNGTFAAPVTTEDDALFSFFGNASFKSVLVADFNGDGKPDLAVAGSSSGTGEVAILLGKGDGTFQAAGITSVPNQDFGVIATGDFNGDGIPDLVAANYYSPGGFTVLLGKGDGTFTTGQQLTLDNFPSSIVVGDFNGDGKLDVAMGFDSYVTVLLGKGNGTFSPAPGSPLQGGGTSLIAGDFNGNGKLDLAGIDKYYYQIDLFEGAGNGTFTKIVTTPNIGQGNGSPFQIVAADFNKDGIPDLALLSNYQDTASILLTEATETATATITGVAPVGAGTHNVEASYAGDTHYGKSVSAAVQLTAGLELPVITPAGGSYTTQQKVTITEAIPGATIYYQALGTVNTSGFVQYTGPFFLPYGGFEEIQAYATETGYQQSNTTTTTYTLNMPPAPAPVLSLAAGRYSGQQTVTITDGAADAEIFYTADGTPPSLYSTAYTGHITVSTSEVVSAVAIAPGYSMSNFASSQYLIGSSQSRFIYTVAGSGTSGYSGDGGPATFATLEYPAEVAIDGSGNLFIGDGNTVREVAAKTGIITTFAGNGKTGYSGDNGAATKAELESVSGLAFDAAGDLYISDGTHCVVREVTAKTGTITTIAGTGNCAFSGDNGQATQAGLNQPGGLAFDKAGNLYIGMQGAIRRVDATGKITTFAGTGYSGYSGDGGPATQAQLNSVSAIVFDATGDLFFLDPQGRMVREVAAGTFTITRVVGKSPQSPWTPGNGDGGLATNATLDNPQGLAIDAAGNLYISDTAYVSVREVTAFNSTSPGVLPGTINTIAGIGGWNCNALGGDGGPALAADLCFPAGLTIDQAGNLYLAENDVNRIREITVPSAPPVAATAAPVFSLAAGTYATAQTLTITAPAGAEVYLTLDGSTPTTSSQGYYNPIAVAGPVTVRAIALAPGLLPSTEVKAVYNVTAPVTATITTVAGSGTYANPGIGGPALKAEFGYPCGIAADSAGNLYIADPNDGVVWKLTAATQTVSVVAGTPGTTGAYSGEGGPATKAILGSPGFVASDPSGNLFISDGGTSRVYKVTAKTGIITTYAGGGQSYDYPVFGDGGSATAAILNNPEGIALDKSGNLYIADLGVGRIRLVHAATGIITSVAGNSSATTLGDGGLATAAMLSGPVNVALDGSGNLFIVETGDARIREVNAETKIITTVAGMGTYGYSGDGGPATEAAIGPYGIAIDAAGAIYFSNADSAIREFVPGGAISTIAGTGYWGFAGDGGPARMAEFCNPAGLAFDKAGSLYIADACNYRVRKVSFTKGAQD